MPNTSFPAPLPNRKVCAVAFDGMPLFEFSISVELFGLDRPEMGPDWYSFQVVGLDEGPCLTTAGVSSSTERGKRSLARTVPDSAGSQSNSPALASRLRRCSSGSGTGTAATSRWVYSVCGLRRI